LGVPEPGRYSPNYNAIYRNVPGVQIRNDKTITKSSSLMNLKHSTLDQNQNKNTIIDGKKATVASGNPSLDSSVNNSIEETVVKDKKKKKPEKGIDFTRFSPRKDPVLVESSQVLSYIEPINYGQVNKRKVRSIDFTKMSMRKDPSGLESSPAVCTYNPENKSIVKNMKDIIEYNTKKKNRRRNYKVLTNYNPPINYQMVQFNK